MRYSEEYKKKAVELYREYEMKEVFVKLANQFPDKYHPNEKTIRLWKNKFKGQPGSKKKPNSNTVDASTLFITQEGIYKKHVGPIRWLGDGYVLKRLSEGSTETPPESSNS